MLLLTSVTDVIQIVATDATQLEIHASYADNASGVVTPGRQNKTVTVSGTTTIVTAPEEGVERNIRTLFIRNDDASNSNNVRVDHTDGTVTSTLWYGNLSAGEEVILEDLDTEEKPFAKRLVSWLVDYFDPDTAFDLGCGPGTYVDCFTDLDVHCTGYDTDERVEGKNNLVCKSLFDVKGTADLILCMEVAEHIDSSKNDEIAQVMFDRLNHDGYLIWTAAKPGQGGVGHINCQTKDYWEDKLKDTGLWRNEFIEQKLKDYVLQGYHMGWFVQNLLVFYKP